MFRPITLFTGQWADMPLEELAPKAKEIGYEGLELACWGDHMDVFKAAEDISYCKKQLNILKKNGIKLFAISNHLAGQLVCDLNNDARSDIFAPSNCACNAEKKRSWAIQSMKNSARAAKNLGINIVNGFTGSSIWHMFYSFPPVSDEVIEEGFRYFARMWNPILDEFDRCGVKFALEVHPTEIAFDIYTAQRTLETIDNRKAFGFNFDPSHLYWQMVDPAKFIHQFKDKIYHVHMKDVALQLDGKNSILASHFNFGDHRRGWDFRSLGHGGVNFEEIIRSLNQIGYSGPLSIEWEDCGMDRFAGAAESCEFVKRKNFRPSCMVFDSAFDKRNNRSQ